MNCFFSHDCQIIKNVNSKPRKGLDWRYSGFLVCLVFVCLFFNYYFSFQTCRATRCGDHFLNKGAAKSRFFLFRDQQKTQTSLRETQAGVLPVPVLSWINGSVASGGATGIRFVPNKTCGSICCGDPFGK